MSWGPNELGPKWVGAQMSQGPKWVRDPNVELDQMCPSPHMLHVTLFLGYFDLKEHLFSVRGFETETSSFAPNGCLRVSIVRFFDARSARMLRMSLRTLWNRWFTKNVYFDEFLKEIRRIFTLLLTFYRSFSSKQVLSDHFRSILRQPFKRAWNFWSVGTLRQPFGAKLEDLRRF